MDRKLIWLLMSVGGVAGGYIPLLWGGSAFSMSSVFTSAVGAFVGIWLGYRISS